MEPIDVRGLSENVAQAIRTIVDALRDIEHAPGDPKADAPDTATVAGRVRTPLDRGDMRQDAGRARAE